MNRAFLCSAIEGLASACGYNFQLSDKTHYPSTVCRYPAATMFQPEFIGIEGRKQGKITYKVTLRFAKNGAKLPPEERNSLLAEMEKQLLELFVALSQDKNVAVVENLSITPCAEVGDTHGAIAMEANANIVTIF